MYLQQRSCRSHRALLERMVGLLTSSAHASCSLSQQPVERKESSSQLLGSRHQDFRLVLTAVCSSEPKGHWLVLRLIL